MVVQCWSTVSGLQLRLIAGSVLADVATPQPQLYESPGLHQAVAQHHQRGHEQMVNIPVWAAWSVMGHQYCQALREHFTGSVK